MYTNVFFLNGVLNLLWGMGRGWDDRKHGEGMRKEGDEYFLGLYKHSLWDQERGQAVKAENLEGKTVKDTCKLEKVKHSSWSTGYHISSKI